MLTREETERLASAIHALRAEWPTGSLCTFIWERRERPLLDLSVELVWVAQLPDTQTPARIDATGPWKRHVRAVEQVNTSSVLPAIDFATACHDCLKPADDPWHNGSGINAHEYINPRDVQPAPRPEGLKA